MRPIVETTMKTRKNFQNNLKLTHNSISAHQCMTSGVLHNPLRNFAKLPQVSLRKFPLHNEKLRKFDEMWANWPLHNESSVSTKFRMLAQTAVYTSTKRSWLLQGEEQL